MGWQRYLDDFHTHSPGITESVLSRATHEGRTPYDWLLDGVPQLERGPVLDLACGSGPLSRRLSGHGYLGVDGSAEELALAAARGAGPLVRADATRLPLVPGSFRVVVCSMSLQILTPLPEVLRETVRVLAPNGCLVALVPDSGPLRGLDALWLTGLLTALGRTLTYPNDPLLGPRLSQLLHDAGLRPAEDRRRRFAYRMRSAADAEVFLDSLYLPCLLPWRRRAARRWLHAAARARAQLPVPVRRIVAFRTG
ncbi:class I SAM-dependent methyltransferase [Streptomyces smyrnaeus]|uniref:Class I SAM-dependent methyltransferase n=1 Tax=Streptomyces smyrnaeus TaxID=1387713 RepID=A0ABS3Y3P0_9ACTN|nr:class I SAM-dependent methyltransferase [Streptomyces smyrnaeus]MBO8202263.1 class I SAM-dependent methyltransferase [Streptomyces smyrnaeus]